MSVNGGAVKRARESSDGYLGGADDILMGYGDSTRSETGLSHTAKRVKHQEGIMADVRLKSSQCAEFVEKMQEAAP